MLQQENITNKDLVELSLISEYMSVVEISDAINRLYRKMQSLANSSNYIVSASASLPSINQTHSSNKITSTINQEKLDTLKQQRYHTMSVWKNRFYISTFHPTNMSLTKGNDPSFIIDIEISKQAIERVLSQISIQNYGNAFFINNEGRYTIYDNKENKHLDTSIGNYLQSKFEDENYKGLENIIINEENYIISFEKSSIVNSTLVMIVPEQQILQKINGLNLWF